MTDTAELTLEIPGMMRSAEFSPCFKYRYLLTRVWNPKLRALNVVGLNPSTATAQIDDPTIRRCLDYARRWGFGALWMTNLFAFRATDPNDMKAAPEPIGEENDFYLQQTAQNAGMVLAAWGNEGGHLDRHDYVLRLLHPLEVYCLKKTKEGFPIHPLYQPATLEPKGFAI